jgi:mannosyl-oligosaccharide glucosidase
MDAFSGHHGIINLFPVAFGLVSDESKLESSLKFAADVEEVFSPYGLRGVSKQDEQYYPGTGYWRGPVWVSVNYLFLRGLNMFYQDANVDLSSANQNIQNATELYDQLRRNHLQVIYDNWEP